MTDKEIEELIKEELIKTKEDEELYDQIYDNLSKQDPELVLNDQFNLSVLEQLRSKKRQLAKERFWVSLGVGFFALVALLTLFITNAMNIFSSLRSIVAYPIIFILLYVIFTRIERVFLKSTTSK